MYKVLPFLLGILTAFAPAFAAERDAGEWVIRAGGRVMINGQRTVIASLDALPKGDFEITGVDLIGTTIDPSQLEKISGLTHVRELFLPGASWTPGAGNRLEANNELRHLAGMKQLQLLQFSLHFLPYFNVNDAGLEKIAGLTQLKELRCAQCRIVKQGLAPFVNLQSLDLSYSAVGDDALASLEGMHDLRRLYLRDDGISDESLKRIGGLTKLEELDLYGVKVSDAGLAYLKNLKNLRKLVLLGAPITDASAPVLAGMPQLRELNLYRSKITNTGLAQLSTLRELAMVDVRYSRVTASGVQALRAAIPGCTVEFAGAPAALGSVRDSKPAANTDAAIAAWVTSVGGKADLVAGRLRGVSLASIPVGDAHVAYLLPLQALEKLDLQTTEVGDRGLEKLASLGSLRDLNLSYTTISDAGLAPLKALSQLQVLRVQNTALDGSGLANLTQLTALRELDLTGSPIKNGALAHLAAMKGLERLSLSATDFTDAGLEQVAKITTLRSLNLNGSDVADAGLRHLSALTGLKELMLNHGRFTDKGLAALKSLTSLERLDLFRTRTGAVAMETIATLRTLRSLTLDYTAVDSKSLALLKGMPELHELSLDSTGVDDQAIETLGSMSKLQVLNLYHTLVSPEGMAKLKALLPNCRIIWERDSALPGRRRVDG